MNFPRSRVRITLTLLYVAAVWVRVDALNQTAYPYYKGESATRFRHAALIAEGGSLPETDRRTSWPEGYAPSRVGAAGVEYFNGFAYRIARLFTDMSHKKFSGVLTVWVFSLSVFAFYSLTQNLWRCWAAGLAAAFLVALSRPLIDVTYGGEYGHAPYAILLVSFHLSLLLKFVRGRSLPVAALSALVGLALLAAWDSADLYLIFYGLVVVFAPGLDASARGRLVFFHLIAMILAGVLLPHLRAERFIVDWACAFFLASTAYFAAGRTLPGKVPPIVYIIAGAILAALILTPLRAGGIEMLSTAEYWISRVRFLGGKPADPQMLSDSVRFLWTQSHSFPRPMTVFEFFLPLLFLIPPAILALREIRREGESSVWPSVVLAALGVVLFLLDRSAILAAALGVFPLVSVSLNGFRRHVKTRLVPVSLGVLLIAAQSFFPRSGADATYRIASSVGVPTGPGDGFLWVSLGNADEELVRHLVTRTSVRDVFLAPPAISSLLVQFGGRIAVLTPGLYTVGAMERTRRFVASFYGDEDGLFELCRSAGVGYVLYSIDLLLDGSKYSYRYGTGATAVDRNSVAFKMHFSPERLRHFNLVYENDNYRLFRVTEDTEPFFLTDHPPVYQEDIMLEHGDDLASFYARIADILVTYHTAREAQARGDDEAAIGRLRYCLDQAPRFTAAWLGVGDSMLRLDRIEAAAAAYARALEIAPDNSHALFYRAASLARLGRTAEALGLLDVLISSSRDKEMLRRARALKASIGG